MTDTLRPSTPITRRLAPRVPGRFFWGNMPEIQNNALNFYTRTALEFGDVVHIQAGPFPMYQLNHPDHIQYVLQDNNRNYDKNNFGNDLLKAPLGNGLLTSDGDFWRRQRRLMQPAFHRQRIAALGERMTAATAQTLERWRANAHNGQSLDIATEMMQLTLSIISQALFTRETGRDADTVSRAATTLVEHLGWKFVTLFPPPDYLPTPRNLRYRRAIRDLDEIVYRIIGERRRHPAEASDLLAMLLEVRDEDTGEGMTDKQLRDEVMTMYLAGHETTAVALAWTFYLLSKHPAVERQLRAEVTATLNGRTPTMADLPTLPYTRRVIDESMRLYPPAWAISRRNLRADEIGGYHIPANSFVFFSPYVMHRHPAYWDNPEGFDPERFTAEQEKGRPRYAYFPFGGGPRQCIGNIFALTEAQLILVMVMQQYRLALVPGQTIEPAPLVTLRPRSGIKMTVKDA